MRRRNLGAMLGLVHQESPISRAELTVRMQLSRGSVGGLLTELNELGLVGFGKATGTRTSAGRPSPIVRAELGTARILTADVGADHISVGYLGLGGTVFARLRRPAPPSYHPETVADVVCEMFSEVTTSTAPPHPLLGVAIGVPGMVEDGLLVRSAPNLGWHDVPFTDLVRQRMPNVRPVITANGANLAALAEHRRGIAQGSAHVVYIGCDDFGVGGGLILNGSQYFGSTGYAGELGHLPINPRGRECHCGSRGCWETEIGTARVAEVLGTAADVDAVAAALRNIDEPSQELTEIGSYLGRGIAAIINLLNVDRVVLGGTLRHLYPTVRSATDAVLDATALPALRRVVTLELSRLGEDAALLGAAELVVERLLADPIGYLEDASH